MLDFTFGRILLYQKAVLIRNTGNGIKQQA